MAVSRSALTRREFLASLVAVTVGPTWLAVGPLPPSNLRVGAMAVAFDTSGISVTNNASPASVTLTVAAGTNRCLVVTFSTPDALTPSTPTGAGATWALFNNTADGGFNFWMWSGIAPNTGSQTVTVSFTGTPSTDHCLSVQSFNGVDQTTPLANYVHQTTASVAVTAASGDGAVSMQDDTAAVRTLSGCTTTKDWSSADLSAAYHGAHCAGPNPTFTWSGISGGAWGAAVQQAAAAAAAVLPGHGYLLSLLRNRAIQHV